MKFGIFDHFDHNGRSLEDHYETRLSLIEAYDRSGLDMYHLAEHHSTPLGMAPSPSVFLAAVARTTKRIHFGPLVYTLALYHPLRLLEEICMLDQMSGGRFEFGVGKGISPIETGFYGVDPKESPEIYAESLAILMQGLTTQRLDFTGKHFQFRDVPLVMEPRQRPHPPMWYGVASPDSTVWCAANGINIGCNSRTPVIRAITDRYRAEWAALGKDPTAIPLMGMTRHIVLAETDAAALATARRIYPAWRASFMNLWQKYGVAPRHSTYAESFDEAARDGFCFAGAPETVRKALAPEIAASGANYFICRLAFGDITLDEGLRSVDLLTRELIPALKSDLAQAA